MTAREIKAKVYQIHTMDEIDAACASVDWMDALIDQRRAAADGSHPGLDITIEPGIRSGRVSTLYQHGKPIAIAILQRDDANFTVATMVEILE